MKIGIYIIRNLENGKVYIGQSTDLMRRLREHKRMLKKGEHPNTLLQRSYNAHDGRFSFKVLEECPESLLDEREVYWISHFDAMDREHGYNRESGGHEGKRWGEESKENRSGVGNPMYGKKHSDEFVEFIRMKNRASSDKLTESNVIDIKRRIVKGERQADIAKDYEVTISTINKIATLHNWDWVAPELNDAVLASIPANSKEVRNQKLLDAYRAGMTVGQCAKVAGCGRLVAYSMLADEIAKRESEREALIENVRADFLAGMSKRAIMAKYSISSTSYIRYTTDLYNEQKSKMIAEVHRLRASGMMVKDIAKELGLHRTTVTEYSKLESW